MRKPLWSLLISVLVSTILLSQTCAINYDYIVVGAGTAGCVVARRLSDDPRINVLLIGNGIDQTGRVENQLPFITPIVSPVPTDYPRFVDVMLTTEGPSYGASGRKSSVALRPRLLGGGSSVNGGAFIRVSNDDLDRLTNEFGLSNWSPSHIGNVIWPRIEKFIPQSSSPVPPGHGVSGPIESRAIPPDVFLSTYSSALQSVTGSLTNPDMGTGNVRGSGIAVRPLGGSGNVDIFGNYTRQDSYNRYIVPVLHRPNLRIIDRATVLNVDGGVACKSTNRQTPCFNQVTYIRDNVLKSVRVKRGGEVIISAGALESPKILMHSGIGNCDELSLHNVDCVKNIPLMGKRVYDHIAFSTLHIIPAPSPNWSSHMGSLMSTYTSTRNDNRINLEFSSTGLPAPGIGHIIINQPVLTSPSSFGEIKLKDADWLTPVNITLGIFKNDTDIQHLLHAYKVVRDSATAVTMGGIPMIQVSPNLAPTATDDEILAWMKENAVADYHTVGTTPMGKCADGATVDDKLRVCGVDGLRVADNGIMPFPYSAHSLHTGALIIGEQVAHFIKYL